MTTLTKFFINKLKKDMIKSNMYPWIVKGGMSWNPIGGACYKYGHCCTYCYVKSFSVPMVKEKYSGKLRIWEPAFHQNLGRNKTVFVESCGDLFADCIPHAWRDRILAYCHKYPENTYLIQSKDPYNYMGHLDDFPPNTILGTTIESNRDDLVDMYSKAPSPHKRAKSMHHIASLNYEYSRMVSIEPIMDFDLEELVEMIRSIEPSFVSIGADSKKNNLPEPSSEKIMKLYNELSEFTEVRLKKNLLRLLEGKA